MFATITENPPERPGKKFNEQSTYGKSTTFAPGRDDWNLPMESEAARKYSVSLISLTIRILVIRLAVCLLKTPVNSMWTWARTKPTTSH